MQLPCHTDYYCQSIQSLNDSSEIYRLVLDAAGRGICIQLYRSQMTLNIHLWLWGHSKNMSNCKYQYILVNRSNNNLNLPVTCVSLLFDKSKLYKTGVPLKVILSPFTYVVEKKILEGFEKRT